VEVTTRNSTTETAGLDKQEGTSLAMRFDPKWIYLFDRNSGNTIAHAAASSAGERSAA
jgi:multiple sugar transport system ATP-binding protein